MLQTSKQNGAPLRFWFSGPTGCGKSTLASLVAKELGSSHFSITVLDGSRLNTATLEAIEDSITSRQGRLEWEIVIVNEAQNIGSASKRLMSMLDNMGKRRCIIFTTMEQGSKAKPLFADWQTDRAVTDRCFVVDLTTQGLKAAAMARLEAIAKAEGLTVNVDTLMERNCNSIRGALMDMQRTGVAA
jgi:adenylate kinase family enzyme